MTLLNIPPNFSNCPVGKENLLCTLSKRDLDALIFALDNLKFCSSQLDDEFFCFYAQLFDDLKKINDFFVLAD